jgi:hypothetical protein
MPGEISILDRQRVTSEHTTEVATETLGVQAMDGNNSEQRTLEEDHQTLVE